MEVRISPYLCCFHTRARQRQGNKTNIEPVHSYDAFHTRHVGPGVKGNIVMHMFNISLVVVLLWCENTIRDSIYVFRNPSQYLNGKDDSNYK